ncbi:MAG TPA: hypothetical protein VID67_09580 [Rhizomicrobium sp.]|jgi:hypothetical protein
MGQNNDPTEHGDLQGQQGAMKGTPKSSYLPGGNGQGPIKPWIPLADESNRKDGEPVK